MFSRIILIVFLLCSCAAVTAQDDLCSVKLTIRGTHLPPLIYADSDSMHGPVIEKIESYLQSKGMSYELISSNWARTLKSAEAGQADGIFPAMRSEERSAFLDYLPEQVGFVTVGRYRLKSPSMGHLAAESGTVVTMRALAKAVIPENMRENIVEVTNFIQALEMVRAGRSAEGILIKEVAELQLSRINATDLEMVEEIGKVPVHLALSRTSSRYEVVKACLERPRASADSPAGQIQNN